MAELKAMLGAEGEALVSSEDTILDRNNAIAFAAEARVQQRLEYDESREVRRALGRRRRLADADSHRASRAASGTSMRRPGARRSSAGASGGTSSSAIEVCRDYVDAQWEYALEKHDGAMVNQYAQRVISTPGKQDGLAWKAADGSVQGPLGGDDRPSSSRRATGSRYEPFHGYYFKVLKGQGPAAPLGEMDFLVKGAMIGGFALVAAPAEYLVTGVKTFIVSHDGIVYEKDLGEKTVELFRAMERYNPDSTWKPVQDD